MKNIFLIAVEVANNVKISLCGVPFHVHVDRDPCNGRVFIQIYHYARLTDDDAVKRHEGSHWYLAGNETPENVADLIRHAFNVFVAERMPKSILVDGKLIDDESAPSLPPVRRAIEKQLFDAELCEI